MQLRIYTRILLKGWWLILLAILLSVSVALVVTIRQTPIYKTSTTFLVSPAKSLESTSLGNTLYSWDLISRREGAMATYVEIATSRSVLNAAYSELALTKSQLKNINVTSEVVPSTNIIKVTVEADDPRLAKTVADMVGQKTITYIQGLSEVYDLKPLDVAFVPPSPSKPQRTQNLVLAVLLGSVVGVGAAFLLHYLRWPVQTIGGINFTDGDTGIFNRRYFSQRLEEELSRAKRHHHPLSIALMDIEHLDLVNDMRLPHLRNEALRRVGLFLKQSLRDEDLVARFEGDKFAVLLPDTPGPEAEQAIQKLQATMEQSAFELGEVGVKLKLGTTAGIVTYNFNGYGRNELIARAEKTLQRARDNGDKIYLVQDDEESETHQDEPAND